VWAEKEEGKKEEALLAKRLFQQVSTLA